MKFQDYYDEPRRVFAPRGDGSRTKQAFAEECDINAIMRRYARTRELPPGAAGSYGDFRGPSELLDAYALVKAAEEQFAALPAPARERFRNRPEVFLAFVQDPKNRREAEELGLVQAKPGPSPELVELKKIAESVATPKPPAA